MLILLIAETSKGYHISKLLTLSGRDSPLLFPVTLVFNQDFVYTLASMFSTLKNQVRMSGGKDYITSCRVVQAKWKETPFTIEEFATTLLWTVTIPCITSGQKEQRDSISLGMSSRSRVNYLRTVPGPDPYICMRTLAELWNISCRL